MKREQEEYPKKYFTPPLPHCEIDARVVSLASEWGLLIFGYSGYKKFLTALWGKYDGFTPISSLPSRRVSGVLVHMNAMRGDVSRALFNSLQEGFKGDKYNNLPFLRQVRGYASGSERSFRMGFREGNPSLSERKAGMP